MKVDIEFLEPKPNKWLPDPLFWILFAVTMLIMFSLILSEVKAEGVDLNIIAKIESNNNPLAVSYKGAKYGR